MGSTNHRWNKVVFYSFNGNGNSRSKGIRIDHTDWSDFLEKLHTRITISSGDSLNICHAGFKEVTESSYPALENGSIIRVITDDPLVVKEPPPPPPPPPKKIVIGPTLQFTNCEPFGPLSCTTSTIDTSTSPWDTLVERLFSEGAALRHQPGANFYAPVLRLFAARGLRPALALRTAGFARELAEAKVHHTRAYGVTLEGWGEEGEGEGGGGGGGAPASLYAHVAQDQRAVYVFALDRGLVDREMEALRAAHLRRRKLPLVLDIDGTIIKNPKSLLSALEFRPHFFDTIGAIHEKYEVLLFSTGVPKHIARVAERINKALGYELVPPERRVSTMEVNWEHRRKEKRLEFVYAFCAAGQEATWDLPLIVDDKPVAWEKKQRRNLIEVREYFGGGEEEDDRTWLEMEEILLQVHAKFFARVVPGGGEEGGEGGGKEEGGTPPHPDVRDVLARVMAGRGGTGPVGGRRPAAAAGEGEEAAAASGAEESEARSEAGSGGGSGEEGGAGGAADEEQEEEEGGAGGGRAEEGGGDGGGHAQG